MSKRPEESNRRRILIRQIILAHFSKSNTEEKIRSLKARVNSEGYDFDELLHQGLKTLDLLENFYDFVSASELETIEPFIDDYKAFDFPFDSQKIKNANQLLSLQLNPFQIEGDSMIGVGIYDGDVVLVEPKKFESGEIAVVRLFDKYFVKQVIISSTCCILVSANNKYQSVEIDNTYDFEIIGRVKYLMRKMNQ